MQDQSTGVGQSKAFAWIHVSCSSIINLVQLRPLVLCVCASMLTVLLSAAESLVPGATGSISHPFPSSSPRPSGVNGVGEGASGRGVVGGAEGARGGGEVARRMVSSLQQHRVA